MHNTVFQSTGFTQAMSLQNLTLPQNQCRIYTVGLYPELKELWAYLTAGYRGVLLAGYVKSWSLKPVVGEYMPFCEKASLLWRQLGLEVHRAIHTISNDGFGITGSKCEGSPSCEAYLNYASHWKGVDALFVLHLNSGRTACVCHSLTSKSKLQQWKAFLG